MSQAAFPGQNAPQGKGLLARIITFPLLEAVARNESARLMLIGAAVGVLGGLAAGAFDWVSVEASRLLLGVSDPSVSSFGAWNKLLAPAGVAALSALLLWYGSTTRKPQGIMVDRVAEEID